jgi:hypothetical protein
MRCISQGNSIREARTVAVHDDIISYHMDLSYLSAEKSMNSITKKREELNKMKNKFGFKRHMYVMGKLRVSRSTYVVN